MKTFVTLPRTISVAGYTATINVKFHTWDEWKRYYCSVSETAKAIKAIAKEAGLTVLKCKSQSYSGGDHVDLILQSKLTPEQREEDRNYYKGINSFWHTNEPEQDLADKICWAFQGGKFNGYEGGRPKLRNGITWYKILLQCFQNSRGSISCNKYKNKYNNTNLIKNMIIKDKYSTYDTETDKLTLNDGTEIKWERITDSTPEWKAMQEWANKYIEILEWKK